MSKGKYSLIFYMVLELINEIKLLNWIIRFRV
jgi:hypothetical protein